MRVGLSIIYLYALYAALIFMHCMLPVIPGYVARMGEERGCVMSWWGNRRDGDHWGDLGMEGWIMLG